MTLDKEIQERIRKLPNSLQRELLDFIQYLTMKAEQQEVQDWESFSLSSAMRDMEDESDLYRISDLKVKYS